MQYTNKYNLPKGIVEALIKNTYDLSKTDTNKISVTTLASSPRQRQLTVRHWNEIEEDASENLWKLFGSAVHDVLERISPEDRLKEERLEEDILGLTVSGKLDLYEKTEKAIEDYKITSVWSVKQEDKKEWMNQVNSYAWLLRKKGFEVEKAYINAILRDWRKSEALKYNDYPPIAYKKVDVELWDFDKQQQYIEERVKLHKSVFETGDSKLPLCTDDERWKTQDKYAVYRNKNKTASRVLDSEQEAEIWIEEATIKDESRNYKNKYSIVKRESTDNKCAGYCSCKLFCDYWQERYGDK